MISGLDVAEAVFRRLDPGARSSGSGRRASGARRARACCASRARARALLTAERTALNFLGRLSGIATLTAQVVRACARRAGRRSSSTRARRRPGLRRAREGGGRRTAAASTTAPGSTTRSSSRRTTPRSRAAWGRRCGARARRGRTCRWRSRCATPAEIDEALAAGAPRLLLDNMTPARAARRGRPGGGPRGARGVRRRDARDSFGLCDHRWARLRLDGGADPLGARRSTSPCSWRHCSP